MDDERPDTEDLEDGDDPGDEPEGPLPEDDEGSPALTPLPGFGSYDPIFGSLGSVGAIEGTSSAPEVVPEHEDLGEVLLHLAGRPQSLGFLVVAAISGGLLLVGLPLAGVAWFEAGRPLIPWAPEWRVACTIVTLLGVLLVVWLGSVARTLFAGGEVDLTTRGIVRRGATTDVWVPWEDVAGYRAGGEDYVLVEWERGVVGLPTPTAEERGEAVRLLDERAVPRLD